MVAALPLLTINVCYFVAIGMDHVPSCIPYLSGCTSVSSTGRLAPESLIFRAGMLTSAPLFIVFWWRNAAIVGIGRKTHVVATTIRVLAIVAALSLALYSLTVGLQGDEYRLLRRIGIDGFALGNFTAQIVFIVYHRGKTQGSARKLMNILVAMCIALPLLGIGAEIAKSLGAPRHAANNVVAWNAYVVMCVYFAMHYGLWPSAKKLANFNSAERSSV